MEMSGNGVWMIGIIMRLLRVTIAFGMPLMIPDLNPGSYVVVRGSTALAVVALPFATTAIRRTSSTASVSVLSVSFREDFLSLDPPNPLEKGEPE
jgi:hypothetical protein